LNNGAFQEVDSASSDLGMLLNGKVGNQTSKCKNWVEIGNRIEDIET